MDEDYENEVVRAYAWGSNWIEVYYGQHHWPSRSCRWWLFEPYWFNR